MRLERLVLPLLLWPAVGAAQEKPTAIVPGLRVGQNVSDPVQKRFDQKLRTELQPHVQIADEAATAAALQGARTTAARCTDAACARKVGEAGKARFVVMANVGNADEIYKVTVAVYDVARDAVTATRSEECELCAVEEVDGTIKKAVAGVKDALLAAPPAAAVAAVPEPTPPPAPTQPTLTVRTDPPGATVLVDGKPVGEAPVTAPIERGQHVIAVQREGFETESRDVVVVEKPLELEFLLRVVAAPEAPMAQPTPAVAATTEPTGARNLAPWGWGLAAGGLAASGVGIWLILIDGEVTCDDGRGRTECPNVYDTKVPGLLASGVGMAALGTGITLLVLDASGVSSGASVAPTADGGATVSWSTRF